MRAWWLLLLLGCTPRDGSEPAASATVAPSEVEPITSAPIATLAPSAPSASVPVPAGLAPAIGLPALDAGAPRVVDLHVDTPWRVHFKDRPLSLPEGHATLEQLERGGYAVIVYPIYIPDYIHDSHPTIADADAIFATIEKLVAAHDRLALVTAGPLADGKIGAVVSIEGAGAFAEDVTQIDRFIKKGVRLIGPVHAHDSALAGSATGSERHGLTAAGKEFCRRVYRGGALIDVSHMSDESFADLVPIAREAGAPIVATHSNCRKLRSHPRNLTDEQLRIIGATGGVVGLNFHRQFVHEGKAKVTHLVEHVRHMIEHAGIDAVAIGSDFDGGEPVLRDASELPRLIDALREAGLSDDDVRKVMGGNAVRILGWQARVLR